MDTGYVVALLDAFIVANPGLYASWVPTYTQLRWDPKRRLHTRCLVSGHWRHHAECAQLVPRLRCVCKYERLVKPALLGTPVRAIKPKYDEDGVWVPPRYRIYVFL